MRCFKAHYRTKFIQRTVDLYETGVTPSEIYDIDQLEAMRLAQDAWNEVDTTTIRNCWQKAGILPQADSELPSMTSDPTRPALPISSLIHPSPPNTTDDPIAHAEKLVTNALDDLEATGALQRSNWIGIAELLNPMVERHDTFNVTDDDIFGSVMEAKKLRERNAGGDESADDDGIGMSESAPLAGPTRTEALQAALSLRKYVATFNDPFTRKLEVMLGSFGQQTRAVEMQSMNDTKLTRYFPHK